MKKIIALSCFIFCLNCVATELYVSENELVVRNNNFRSLSDRASRAASGSDIVGNGGGIAEQNLIYSLRHLDRYLVRCLNFGGCFDNQIERDVARKLVNLALEKRFQKDSLLFLDGPNFKQFFNGALDPGERVAKTGFSREFPIFINISAIYGNHLESDTSALVGILIHELGHQLGIVNHRFLDQLAVKVRGVFELFFNEYEINFSGQRIKLSHYTESDTHSFDLGILSVGEQMFPFSVSGEDYQCSGEKQLIGSMWSNPHFMRPELFKDELYVTVSVWAQMYCLDSYTGLTEVEETTLKFKFDLKKSGPENNFGLLRFDVEGE